MDTGVDIQEPAPIVSSIEDAEALWFSGALLTILADGEQTGGRFAIVDATLPEGTSPAWHVQPEDDETFYVLDGEITFWAGDRDQPVRRATPGTLVSIPRGTPHSFRVETETARLLTIHTPAGHERFYRAGGDPAPQRTLPPPGAADIPRLQAAGRQHAVEFLGPPPTNPEHT
ncbi:MAG TPA: quercetin 2,3-dioxygenase [Solirubrobacteraceae bacterium]|nr:quercetin 2,3-dioxygenase [Solirubrobacteraceae bacterium]